MAQYAGYSIQRMTYFESWNPKMRSNVTLFSNPSQKRGEFLKPHLCPFCCAGVADFAGLCRILPNYLVEGFSVGFPGCMCINSLCRSTHHARKCRLVNSDPHRTIAIAAGPNQPRTAPSLVSTSGCGEDAGQTMLHARSCNSEAKG